MKIASNGPKQDEPNKSTEMIQIPQQEYDDMKKLLAQMNARLAKLEERPDRST